MKETIRSFPRYALLLLMVVYVGFIVCFTHIHIINGVIISHVHVEFQKDKERSTSDEPHSANELVMYGQLSFVGVPLLEVAPFEIKEPATWIRVTNVIRKYSRALFSIANSFCYLRAPPISIYSF